MLLAIDPGEEHAGLAWFAGTEFRNCNTSAPVSALNKIWIAAEQHRWDHIVIEEWRNYGATSTWSECKTAEMIGAVQFIGDYWRIPVTRQPARIKRMAEGLIRRQDLRYPEGADRHSLDAYLHGVWWLYNNRDTEKQ